MNECPPGEIALTVAKKARGMTYRLTRVVKTRPPVWRSLYFVLFATLVLLLAWGFAPGLWHLVGPDEAPSKTPPAAVVELEWDGIFKEITFATNAAGKIDEVMRAGGIPEAVATGAHFDATLTAKFVAGVESALTREQNAASKISAVPADCARYDGFLRARLALARDRNDVVALAEAARSRLRLARAFTLAASTLEDFADALLRERDVFKEIRFDAERFATGEEPLRALLETLMEISKAPAESLTSGLARRIDASLDTAPDAGMRAMSEKTNSPDGTGFFTRLARFGRKPNAYRKQVSAMHARFGKSLAQPTYLLAGRALGLPGNPAENDYAAMFLREESFARVPGDVAHSYYFFKKSPEAAGVPEFASRCLAFRDSEDLYGAAMLLRRNAAFSVEVARFSLVRFDSAATAYALAMHRRRALSPQKKWPASTEGLFDGLLERYPADPFSDEPVAYSPKKHEFVSPGADFIDAGGLDEPEYASRLAQLWEPTVSLLLLPDTKAPEYGENPTGDAK